MREVEALLGEQDIATTSTRTRDLLAMREKELEKYKVPPTTTRTREKLAEVDAKLKEVMDHRTSTRTRLQMSQNDNLSRYLVADLK